jgi:hypothetical protein
MGSWDFSNIGFIGNKNNVENIKNLLEIMGINFEDVHGSETGSINKAFLDVDYIGENNGSFTPIEIYTIVNKLFKNTTILYENENGNNTCDYYYRYEEVYKPKTKKIEIAEKDYCYDGNEVFGESAYEAIKDECEKEAEKQGIEIEWGDDYPEGDEFYDLCESILEQHGGIEGLGTRKDTETIENIEIENEKIDKLINIATEKGYNEIVDLLNKKFKE